MPKGELVWPSRGVVVIANETMAKSIVRVGSFIPTTLEGYQKLLRFDGATEDEDKTAE